tara:strand:+ start:5547 stop:5831 length:285 start_codon:yes stop_codon:yes gene_type:complete
MSELITYLENILDVEEVERAIYLKGIDESFKSERERLHTKGLQTQLAEKDAEILELHGIIGVTKGLLKDAMSNYSMADKKDLCIDFILSTLEDD